MTLYRSKHVVLPDTIQEAGILVENGKIVEILLGDQLEKSTEPTIIDYGDLVLMPGVVDSHVHVNEPGRTEWEGFRTATRAAAKGGVTTIVDMPLNAIPPTTSVENLQKKMQSAKGATYVDIAFWGGVIPNNHNELVDLVEAGVVGFKCFLCPSGVDEFPNVNKTEVEVALKTLQPTNSVLAFHAELDEKISLGDSDPTSYQTFLNSRPSSMEVNAIRLITKLCAEYNVRCHIVHLSASDALPLIRECKRKCKNLTVETCYHYLTLTSGEILNGKTEFKCCPPIRDDRNRDELWAAIKSGEIDLVVSDHSPCTPDLKFLSDGKNPLADFMKAWGGISSLQFGLSLLWTEGRKRGLSIRDISTLISTNPAKLCGLDRKKGAIRVGLDADFVVWNPEESFIVKANDIEHKNKVSPYIGKKLTGTIHWTILRGQVIYNNESGITNERLGNINITKI